jgi:hypothetical protein
MPEFEDDDFELIPTSPFEITPEEQLEEAEALLDEPLEIGEEPVEPYGMSWLWDFEAKRFVRFGNAPVRVTGITTLAMRVQSVARIMRFAHPIFSDDIGMEDPYRLIGKKKDGDALQSYISDFAEAVLALDRVAEIPDITVLPSDYADAIELEVQLVTDDEENLTIDVTIPTGTDIAQ